MKDSSTRSKILLFIGGALILVFFLWILIDLSQAKNKTAMIEFEIVPSNAKITVDGKRVSSGKQKFVPGQLLIEVSKKGFTTRNKNVNLSAGQNTYIGLSLSPNSSSTSDYYDKHPEEDTKVERISSREFDEENKVANLYSPIINYLPIIDPSFRIDQGSSTKDADENGSFALYIQASTAENRSLALDWLKTHHFDSSDIEIIFKDAPKDIQ